MIRINIVGIFWLILFFFAIWFGWPVWIAIAWLLAEQPHFRWFLAGLVSGCFFPIAIGWNMALRHRRQQMIDRADDEYNRDKRRLWNTRKERQR